MEWICSDGIRIKDEEDDAADADAAVAVVVLDPPLALSLVLLSVREVTGTAVLVVIALRLVWMWLPLIVTPGTEKKTAVKTKNLVTFPFVDAGNQVFIDCSRCVEGYERCFVSVVLMYQNKCVWMDQLQRLWVLLMN
jgi:hypothetical protein